MPGRGFCFKQKARQSRKSNRTLLRTASRINSAVSRKSDRTLLRTESRINSAVSRKSNRTLPRAESQVELCNEQNGPTRPAHPRSNRLFSRICFTVDCRDLVSLCLRCGRGLAVLSGAICYSGSVTQNYLVRGASVSHIL